MFHIIAPIQIFNRGVYPLWSAEVDRTYYCIVTHVKDIAHNATAEAS